MRQRSRSFTLRPATPEDLLPVAEIYLAARDAAYPAMPRAIHPPEDVRGWVSSWDLNSDEIWLAVDEDRLLGFARIAGDSLEGLYIDPASQGSGVGAALLDRVKERRPGGFDLWVFVSNTPARRFYARHGLVEVERTDGSTNEERAPDVRMCWPPRRPVRTGLQRHSPAPGT